MDLRPCVALLSLAFTVVGSQEIRAQTAPVHGHWEFQPMSSGNCPNPGPLAATVFQQLVVVDPAAPWLRIHFSRAHLDKGSYLRVTSMRDGDVQTMQQDHLQQWGFSTAFFNGNAVMLEIVGGRFTAKNFLEIGKLWVGDPAMQDPVPESICGSIDSRAPSSHPAVGRLLSSGLSGGCTGWIIDRPQSGNDKCHLSAGHCFPGSDVLQFAVPSSSANCSLTHPSASLQFAVDHSSRVSVSGSIGDDYGVFRCFPNSTTGLTTFQTQNAAIALQSTLPGSGATLRVTGFGVDGTDTDNATGGNTLSCNCASSLGTGQRNQTQQSSTGPLVGAGGTIATYQVDTCGGNSGSPVFDESTGAAIAIHTNGGCSNPVTVTSNSGTLVAAPAVQNAITAVCPSVANDECTGAVAVFEGVNGPYSNSGASTSSAWPCVSGGSDVWFAFVATCTAPVTFETCSPTRSFDTVLEVYSGGCGALTSLGCDDDTCGLGSSVTASLTQGVTYHVRVGGYNAAQGAFDLTVRLGTGAGQFQRLALGCGAATITPTGSPNIGGTVALQLGGVTGIPVIGIGVNTINVPLCPSCTIGLDYLSIEPVSSLSIPIPCSAAFIGGTAGFQGIDLLGSGGCATPIQAALTDVIVVTIG